MSINKTVTITNELTLEIVPFKEIKTSTGFLYEDELYFRTDRTIDPHAISLVTGMATSFNMECKVTPVNLTISIH